jgi:acylphosphatase
MHRSVHIVVRGRVQGVGFRAFVEHHARQRGLDGWVRNRRDETVEAMFAGEPPEVDGMLAAVKIGPLGARVDEVDERDAGDQDLTLRRPGESFSVLPTL